MTWLLHPDPSYLISRQLALTGSGVVAEIVLEATDPSSPEYETNRHLMWGELWVLEAYRRVGIASGWIPWAVETMDRHGATVLGLPAWQASGAAFLRAIGAGPKMVDRESRLDLGAVDWDRVAAWVRQGPARSPRTRFEFHQGRIPEAVIDEYSAVLSRLLNTIPFEDLDHGEIVKSPERLRSWYSRLEAVGGLQLTALTREADGSISGLTEMYRYPHQPGFAHQGLTAVRPDARGRGLGRWLKGAMLQRLRELHPETEVVLTENAGSNEPMLAINRDLGFRPWRSVTVYQVGRDRLAEAARAS